MIGHAVKGITIPADVTEWLKEALREESKEAIELQEKRVNALKIQHDRINNRLSRLYDAKFDNELTKEVFIAKEKEYQAELIEVKAQMDALERRNPRYYEDGAQILELCNRMHSLYVKAGREEKAKLATLIASNYTLVDATLVPTYRKPFSFIAKGLSCSDWLPVLDEIRNWLMNASVPSAVLGTVKVVNFSKVKS
jgi:site-specific DNA recombinase